MDDLISRKALLEFAHNHIGGRIDCNDIARFPAVDAELVRHGEWIPGDYYDIGDVCSKCDWDSRQISPLYHYCPNCGACMMDGGKKE